MLLFDQKYDMEKMAAGLDLILIAQVYMTRI